MGKTVDFVRADGSEQPIGCQRARGGGRPPLAMGVVGAALGPPFTVSFLCHLYGLSHR